MKMNLFFLAVFISLPLHALYVGSTNTEALLKFNHKVHFTSEKPPSEAFALSKITEQVKFLHGALAEASPAASPKEEFRIDQLQIESQGNNEYVAKYQFTGKFVLENENLKTYTLPLPYDASTIFSSSFITVKGKKVQACAIENNPSQKTYWYSWDPRQENCPQVDGKEYHLVEAKVERYRNISRSYPEYNRMVDKNNEIRISLFFGMNQSLYSTNPGNSKDVSAHNYLAARKSLLDLGFSEKTYNDADIAKILPIKVNRLPYVQEFYKKGKRANLKIILFMGITKLQDGATAFHYFYQGALSNSSVIVYDGHSGFGSNLRFDKIKQASGIDLSLPKERYQILFFNSCSSYSYYNNLYFDLKKTDKDQRGSKNLDILTTGLATPFELDHETTLVLVRAIDQWSNQKGAMSYQDLAKQMDVDNLLGVNGDEDNPTYMK